MISTAAAPNLHSQELHSHPVSCPLAGQVLSHSTPWGCWCLVTVFYTTVLYHLSNWLSSIFVYLHLCYLFFCLYCLPEQMGSSFLNEGIFKEPPSQRPQHQPLVLLSSASSMPPLPPSHSSPCNWLTWVRQTPNSLTLPWPRQTFMCSCSRVHSSNLCSCLPFSHF